MKLPKKWFKDVVVVKFHDNAYAGNIVLPTAIKHNEKICKAEVLILGSEFRFKDHVKVGDFVYVDSWLGTRRTFDDTGEVVTFDGEDIYGLAK